jgi:hypothetical protein
MAKSDSDDAVTKVVGGTVVGIIVLVSMVPKEVWIAIGIVVAVLVTIGITRWAIAEGKRRREAAASRERAEREANARKEKERRVASLGKKNATLVESALAAAEQVAGSEAARAGWLGDIDFSRDIETVSEDLRRAHALRGAASELSALDKPSAEDRAILADAKAGMANLERVATERVALILKCAEESRLIDASLRQERVDARTAEQRAELHGTLSALLYGAEATPAASRADSAADAVIARVQAYRELKNQITSAA